MTNSNDVMKNDTLGRKPISVELLVKVAVMAAITFVSAYVLHVPYINGNVLHLGDGMVFIGAVILGPVWGAVSAAIGMSLFDVISGYAVWAPFTFVIKAVMALVAGLFAAGLRAEVVKRSAWVKALIGMILGALLMVAGYYVAEGLLYGNWKTPVLMIPGNLAQSGFGVIVGMVILMALWRTAFKRYFLK